MVFKELLSKLGEKRREKKELLRQLDERMQVEKTLEERKKSANQRELEGYMKEDYEEEVKNKLEYYRKKRDADIKFNHNPLNAKNIMKAEWEVMKEKNQFAGKSNMFANQSFIHKNNPNLLKNNKKLY